jgi:arylsulfatase A-like enzyme/HEAT repeat protein
VRRLAERLGGRADTERAARLRRRLWPLPYLALASPALAAVGHLLFTGGTARKLPARALLEVLATVVLLAATYASMRAGSALRERVRRGGAWRGAFVGLGLLVVAGALGRVDQAVLPNLYDYLHTALTVATWLVVGLALACIADGGALSNKLVAPGVLVLTTTLFVCVASFATALVTMDGAPDVRVALFDAHASNSRSLMMGLEPLLTEARHASADSVTRARRARERRRVLASGEGLPVWEDAHVLLVTIDALRADHLGAYGYARPTSPALDAIAEEAVVFERAYAQAPHSSYSLSTLMTSEYVHETVALSSALPEDTLATALNRARYDTVALFPLGIFHTEGERLARYRDTSFGFERTDHRDLDATMKTDAAIDALRRVARAGEPRSFVWVHYFDAHEPYQDTTFGTTDVDRYDSEIRHVDTEVERLLESAASILTREIVLVVTADHGEEFRDHGGVYHGSTLYDEQVRVPLLLRAEGLGARRVRAPVEVIDIAPTLLGMVGAPRPPAMRGDDLRALALGRVEDVGPAFSSVGMKRMVLAPPYKLVADLRYDLFELYDLDRDPRERDNLARREPERLEDMRGELFAWLDALRAPPGANDGALRDPRLAALERARLGDRRAAETLVETLSDPDEDRALRASAARALGELDVRSARRALARGLADDGGGVATECAVALGRLYDQRAREPLASALAIEDTRDRARVAVALARLGDPRAVPHLADAARDAEDRRDAAEAVRRLGLLAGPAAFEPLVALMGEFDTRRHALLALGTVHDPRAHDVLVRALAEDTHASMRDAAVQSLGQRGDPRAIPLLSALARDEPGLRLTTESLVRLDAIARGAVGGADLAPTEDEGTREGIGACEARREDDIWHFRDQTSCETSAPRASIRLAPPPEDADGDVTVIVRLRRVDAADPTRVSVTIGAAETIALEVDGSWSEPRFHVPRAALALPDLRAVLDVGAATVAIDHVLLLAP